MHSRWVKVVLGGITLLASTGLSGEVAIAEVYESGDLRTGLVRHCSANQRLITDINSPMAEQRALAMIGSNASDAVAELIRIQERVLAICSCG